MSIWIEKKRKSRIGIKIVSSLILFGYLFLSINSLYADNLGTFGATFPIQEENLLTFIQEKLLALQKSGQLETLEKTMQARSEEKAIRPDPVMGIVHATQNKKWDFDPSIQISEDIKNANGQIIILKGTVVNPLDHIQLHELLIFYDGDDEAENRFVQKELKKFQNHQFPSFIHRVKLILVKGSIKEEVARFKMPIYFDQSGKLTTRFGITEVPATAMQQGNHLIISEVKVDEAS